MPRMKNCPACRGTGKPSEQTEAFAIRSELVRKAALHEVSKMLIYHEGDERMMKLHRILANNHPNGTFTGATENSSAANDELKHRRE